MTEFPAVVFRLDGEPGAIEASGRQWSLFGATATEAAGHIRSLDTSLFVGPEGETYREGLNAHLPPHLEVTGRAYGTVGSALGTFAGALSGLHERMQPLATRAPGLWQDLQAAQGRVAVARAADARHAADVERAQANQSDQAGPGGEADKPGTYHSDTAAATGALSQAEQAWNECITAAKLVKADLSHAVDVAARAIRQAAESRFEHNPHGFGAMVAGFKGFVKDHAKGLAQLSSVLKGISTVAGLLSFIPVIGEVAAPIALIAGAGALLIDASLKYATGQGSWTSIIIDGALLALPFVGKAVRPLVGDAVKAWQASRTAKAAEEVSDVPAVVFSRSRGPGIAQNFDEAVAQGAPTRLNRVAKAARDANRRAALRGQPPPPPGQSLDEYPFASSAQGGAGSHVRSVPKGEQNYQGGVLSRFYQDNNVAPGDPFDVRFEP
jgi:Deoxyribonuclease NucA/NucB/Cricket paralysis virus, VP4